MESSNNFSATLFKVLGYIFFFTAFAYLGMTLANFFTNGEGLIGEEQFQYIGSFYLVVALFTSTNLVFSGIFILIGNLIFHLLILEFHQLTLLEFILGLLNVENLLTLLVL